MTGQAARLEADLVPELDGHLDLALLYLPRYRLLRHLETVTDLLQRYRLLALQIAHPVTHRLVRQFLFLQFALYFNDLKPFEALA